MEVRGCHGDVYHQPPNFYNKDRTYEKKITRKVENMTKKSQIVKNMKLFTTKIRQMSMIISDLQHT